MTEIKELTREQWKQVAVERHSECERLADHIAKLEAGVRRALTLAARQKVDNYFTAELKQLLNSKGDA